MGCAEDFADGTGEGSSKALESEALGDRENVLKGDSTAVSDGGTLWSSTWAFIQSLDELA